MEQCSKASQSMDGRDKYFMAYVPEFDPSYGKSFGSALPALEISVAFFLPKLLPVVHVF